MSDVRSQRKLQKATRFLSQGQAREAADLCRMAIEAQPDSLAGHLLLSKACQQLGDFDGMLDAARGAVNARPRNVDARLRFAECLLLNGDVAAALKVVRNIEATATERKGALLRVGEFFVHCGQHEDAYRCQLAALQLAPDDPECVYALASSSVAIGELEQAEQLYDRLIFLDPDDHDAWYNRSTLRRQSRDDNHIRNLAFVLDQLPGDHPGRVPVCYALAKEWEDIDHFDEAFHYLQAGAAARRARLSYDVASDEEAMRLIAATHDSEWLADSRPGHDSEAPIFILGLPRSGTTLVERIVSGHSAVDSLGEINTFALTLTRLAGGSRQRLNLVRASTELDFRALGERYVESAAGYGKPGPRLIDKTPLNFLYLGLIRKALPNARVIHLRRFAMDSCFAMYKTLFRMGYPFSYSLQDVGRYYMAYHDLMAHWRSVMPDFFLDVDYEKLVDDTEPEVRRILDFLGLEFQVDCLEFHRHKSPSATASAAQVRQPIYSSSVNRWKSYRRQLGPLAQKLKDYGIEVR